MKSPFPGMDPYIEECGLFEDLHQSLIDEMARALAKAVPSRYVVRKGKRAYVELTENENPKEHVFKPDVGIVAPATHPTLVPEGGLAVADPDADTESISMRAFIAEEFRESFIEIYVTEPDRQLVTCIEVLSPSNKRHKSEGWDTYLRKRRGLLSGSANFVELDLLRKGTRMPMLDPWPNSPYTLLIARRHLAPRCRVLPAHYVRALPSLWVPLIKPDADVTLNIQGMIDSIHAEFHYDRDIDYTRPLTPPLTADDSAWLAQQMQQRS